ncbi:MAG: GTPase domain-containing protein [Deltaproteobacteria bacterium]|nr:GTPase domain-containing protein [Deltaproteobacteria bacterium]MBN2673642.1 GTPase domain-containing protein [Deltaproteobacteria bacterium]
MPYISYDKKEISFKIVYYGPGMSGKTTNLMYIHNSLAENLRGELVSLDTEEERTLFFDFFPLELGQIAGYDVKFNLYTIPGQIYYEASRKLMLEGADGVVFVADSNPLRFDRNITSYEMMLDNLASYHIDAEQFPIVLQYNKRDFPDAIERGSLEKVLEIQVPSLEAVATSGEGVMETIRTISKMIIEGFEL